MKPSWTSETYRRFNSRTTTFRPSTQSGTKQNQQSLTDSLTANWKVCPRCKLNSRKNCNTCCNARPRSRAHSVRFGSGGPHVANPTCPDAGGERGPSPTTKFNPSSRVVEGEGCQTARGSVRTHPDRPSRPRVLDDRPHGVAGRDRVWRPRVHPLFDGSHPPRGGADSEGPFHGHQCGVHVRNISHRCGLRGCRVGEASNPGPVQTRNARRLQSTQLDCESGSSFNVVDSTSQRGQTPPSISRGRFHVLSSEGEEEEVFHVCTARSSVDHRGRVVVRSSQTVPSPPKRLRLSCGDLPRLSQASTVPRPPQSLCDALEFDLTREDSDHDPLSLVCGGTVADPPSLSVETQQDHNRFSATESDESDTESVQRQSNRRRRLQLTWNSEQQDMPPPIVVQDPPDSHDERVARVRQTTRQERRERPSSSFSALWIVWDPFPWREASHASFVDSSGQC